MKRTGYTLKEVSKHNKRNDCWIILYENVYDITEFMKHHSGKDLPLQVAGKDGTGLFESIHPKRAKTILNSNDFKTKYYKGYIIRRKCNLTNNFKYDSDFGKQLNERVENYFESVKNTSKERGGRNEKIIVYGKFIIITMFALWTKYNSIIRKKYLHSFLHGLSMTLLAFNVMHGANHGELIKRYPNWFSKICEKYNLFLYHLPSEWKRSHNVSHHQYTNTKLDEDTDINCFGKVNPWKKYKKYFLYQHVSVFFTAYILTPFKYNHFFLLLMPLSLKFKLCRNMLVELITWGVLHVLINHVTHLNNETEFNECKNCWYENQIRSTSNWSCNNILITHLLGGINHQIEHHLFQSVHHYHYPAIRKIVKQTCKESNIRYNEFPNYLSALYSHYKLLRKYSTP